MRTDFLSLHVTPSHKTQISHVTLSFSSFSGNGKWTSLVLVASGCSPCGSEIPAFGALYDIFERTSDKNSRYIDLFL